jgi:hypothetical protein
MDPLENYDNNVRNRDDSTIISKRSIANIININYHWS